MTLSGVLSPTSALSAEFADSLFWFFTGALLCLGFFKSWLSTSNDEPATGIVVVTGSDSGMGFTTAVHLVQQGWHVTAGCISKDSEEKLRAELGTQEQQRLLETVLLDVTSDKSVDAAVEAVARRGMPLTAVVNCAGVAFTGPAEYMAIEHFSRQLDVNFLGYVRVFQKFSGLLRLSAAARGGRRSRVVFVGTGGGVPSPSPALISAYMASKWAVEAFVQSLRMEMRLTKQRVDALMVNPGFVKPTSLMANGQILIERMWSKTPDPGKAKAEYAHLLGAFQTFSEKQVGTHPIEVAKAIESSLRARSPRLRYKVGTDSKMAPFVGLLPTSVREWMLEQMLLEHL